MKGDGRMPKYVMSFSLWVGGFFCKAFDEFVITPNLNVVGFEIFQPKTEGGMEVVVVSASVLRIASLTINEIVNGDSVVGEVDEAVRFNGIATTQINEPFVFV